LKKVYHPAANHRAIFKAAVQEYCDLRKHQVRLKSQIKAKFRQWGVFDVSSDAFGKAREGYLERVPDRAIRRQLERSYTLMDEALSQQLQSFRAFKQLGRRYPEIKRFKEVPGVGDYCSHVFSAFVWDPHRFATKQRLWSYSKLSITDRKSDGKPLGFQRIDSAGNSELKDLSFIAFRAAMRRAQDNEIVQFYNASLERTHDHTHARLNTQRKILAVMLSMWKHCEPYNPERFYQKEENN
jgi:transposase